MAMGLLDAPAPILAWADRLLGAVLPPTGSLLVWAALGALASMEVYRLLSPQTVLRDVRREMNDARRRLNQFEGEFSVAVPLIRRVLGCSFRQVGLVTPPVLAASVPLLVLIVWLSNAYGYIYPPAGESAALAVPDGTYTARWATDGSPAGHRIEIRNDAGETVAVVALDAPATVIHKKRWWNVLVGNPAGYLPADAPVDRISIDLPRRLFMELGPDWMRGWEAPFLSTLLACSLVLKSVRRIV